MKIHDSFENISVVASCIENDILYAAGHEQNLLFKFDLNNFKLEKLARFDGFKLQNSFRIGAIYKYGESLFCFSKYSYEIAEFDLRHYKLNYYHPENNCEEEKIIYSFCRADADVWLFCESSDMDVLVFSMREKKYFLYALTGGNHEKIDKFAPVGFEDTVYTKPRIWRCICGSSNLITVDTRTKESYIVETGLEMSFYSMSYQEGDLYILTRDGKHIVKFKTTTFRIFIYETGYNGRSEKPFRQVVRIKNQIFLLPCFEQDIWCYKIVENCILLTHKLSIPKEFEKIYDVERRSLFLRWEKSGNKLYLLPFAGNGMLSIELDTLDIAYYPIKRSKQDFLIEWVTACGLMSEKELDLEDYLTMIKAELQKSNKAGEALAKTGKGIWEAVSDI